MSYYIIIRDYKISDMPQVSEVVRNAYLSNVPSSFISALTREITFQLIVTLAAIMFIFFGVHLIYCVMAIPFVMIIIYTSIYLAFWIKASELMQSKRPLQCFVAEACIPFFADQNSQKLSYRIISEQKLMDEGIEVGGLQRMIVGTVAVSNFFLLDNSAWMFRLAVDAKYRHKGIGHALVETTKHWCKSKRYERVLLAMSECQESCRQLFISTGFQMKQMYHKQLFGSFVTLLMYQLECDLLKPDF